MVGGENKKYKVKEYTLTFGKHILLWKSQNRGHQKYLWNVIVLQEISQ